jgi:trigger factor
MASSERDDEQDEGLSLPEGGSIAQVEGAAPDEEAKPKLNLQVDVQKRSACERHIAVTVSREDIDRYLEKEFSELMSTAQVPGFRPGHVPRRLVEMRFRKDVGERVKSALLMDSVAQISEEQEFAAIGEPDFDVDAIELPDEGPMTYEFDLEVRPDFDLPQWKGLLIERPVHEFTDKDVEQALKDLLARAGKLVPHDGPAEAGDYISTGLTFTHGGNVLSASKEELIRIRPVLTFRDGRIEGFDELMKGVRAGETRVGEARLSDDAPNEALRGQAVTATFEVKEVKKLELPDITPQLLDELGDFESEAELRDAVRDSLQRRLEYQQRQRAREQIARALTVAADWELPPDLLRRQSEREFSRAVIELRSSGFSEDEIRLHLNELRQNSRAATARALKEHFIFERIADEEKITDTAEDQEAEIQLIARQSGETPRRVRARLEKSGRMDVLRNHIIERKVVDLILANAQFTDVPYRPEKVEAEALDRAAGGPSEGGIPEATP